MQGALAEPVPPRFVMVPKLRGGARRFTTLGPSDADRYRLLVGRLAGVIERTLGACVHSDRVIPGTILQLEPWRRARDRFRRTLSRLVSAGGAGAQPVVVRADVRRCFERIDPAVVERALCAVGCGEDEVADVRRLLERFGEAGVPGLPVGPAASAVLANAVLSSADRRIGSEGIRHVRWVDDFVIVAPSEPKAEGALARLCVSLEDLGLEIAPEKTRILRAADIVGQTWLLSGCEGFGLQSSR